MKYLLATAALLAMIGTASADSCWIHNGSLMRLEASGHDRTFTYENPRPGMWGIGVEAGTELFTGESDGRSYWGTAKVFTPLGERSYQVSGPISNGQKRVTLYGNTGIVSLDTLVFTYVGQCRTWD
jgi:hypothetical protein